MEENDYYMIHLNKENSLKDEFKKINELSLQYSGLCVYNMYFVINEYNIIYKNKIIFRFEMKTYNDIFKTFILKNNKKIDITDYDNLIEFVKDCEKHTYKILEDFKKIEENFYIDDWNQYYDEIYLKRKVNSDVKSVVISINMNNTYEILINNFNNFEYNSIDELLLSSHLNNLKKDLLHSFLQCIKLF